MRAFFLGYYSGVVGTCSRLATILDVAMFLRHGVKRIYPPGTPLDAMIADDPRGVINLPDQVGDRFLLRYLRNRPGGSTNPGPSDATVYVTTTPYSPEEVVSWLAVPFAREPRTQVLLLDPLRLTDPHPDGRPRRILGPRWVQYGSGIEYVLESGYPQDAIVSVSADSRAFLWTLEVT